MQTFYAVVMTVIAINLTLLTLNAFSGRAHADGPLRVVISGIDLDDRGCSNSFRYMSEKCALPVRTGEPLTVKIDQK